MAQFTNDAEFDRSPDLAGLTSGHEVGPPDDPDAIEGSELYRLLIQAIDGQQVLAIRYEGEAETRRVCPDRIGIDPHDQYQVEAFQLSGPSASGAGAHEWKCFHLSRIEIVGVEDKGWVAGPRETARSHCFDQVVHPAPGTE